MPSVTPHEIGRLPYLSRWCPQAMLEVERCSGSQFDPPVVRAFRSVAPR
jgi:hypothetical protein